jgi:CheY-like chemotaxis protein
VEAAAEVTARCPRCKGLITATPTEQGFLACPQCGARLKSATTPAPPDYGVLLAEVRELRRGQEENVRLLREVLAIVRSAVAPAGEEPPAPAPSRRPPVQPRHRQKTVLLVDDDNEARRESEAAFRAAHVPVRAVADGKAAIAAIAAEQPDIIVLELGIAEPMPGRDVINMIKATMEWVGIPIVLYTRLPIESQEEARDIHGADDLVAKGPASVEALIARVIQIFQRVR